MSMIEIPLESVLAWSVGLSLPIAGQLFRLLLPRFDIQRPGVSRFARWTSMPARRSSSSLERLTSKIGLASPAARSTGCCQQGPDTVQRGKSNSLLGL